MEKSDLLTPSEVGRMFGVGPKTVVKWSNKGWLTTCKTLGGHRRYMREEVEVLLTQIKVKAVKGATMWGDTASENE